MKVPAILELLFFCALVAFVSSKNVHRRIARVEAIPEATTLKSNVSSAVRQDIQVVQELTDSQEAAVIPVEADVNPISDVVKPISVESNEIENKPTVEDPVNENDPNPINKYCSCSSATCKCCRDFNIPLIPIRGPGCATIRYLDNDRLSIGIKYGDLVLASRTVDSRRPTPICLPLPGGYNRFCGRVYGISRQEENFKACLGLELRADDDVEASLRVSCFQFGPKGLATMEAEPLPPNITDEDEDDDDDDDDDEDPLGLGEFGGDDDDDDDDDDSDEGTGGGGGFVGDVLGGILGGGGGGGGDDDDDDFGLTRFLGSASDFVTDFFGGDSQSQKNKPNSDIKINRRNDEKTKKKPEIVKKTPKNSASKLKEDEAEDKKEESVIETIDDLTADDEQSTEEPTEKAESVEVEHDETASEKDDDDEDDDEDDEYDDEYKDEKTEKNGVKPTDAKPVKKKKATSSFGFGYFGRFFNIFS